MLSLALNCTNSFNNRIYSIVIFDPDVIVSIITGFIFLGETKSGIQGKLASLCTLCLYKDGKI